MGAMSDINKAAVLLASLPPEDAAQLLSKLEPKQVEQVSIEIAKLDHIGGQKQESVAQEFCDANPSSSGGAGGINLAENLVAMALGKNASGTLDNVRQSIEALPFGFLKNVDNQHLLTFIMDEHPQTIALVLSHMGPAQGAEILSGLPTETQLNVIRRVASMGQTNPEIIQEVERGLESRLANVMSQSFEHAGGVPSVAEILNVTDRATERSLLENLAMEDPDLVEEIRRLMFVFEDITKFSDKDIQNVLKNVESNEWAMALKGASAELTEKVLGNMSQRAADLLKEEMEYLGPMKLSAVEQVQQQIVDIVRRLEDCGELAINVNEEDEQLIA